MAFYRNMLVLCAAAALLCGAANARMLCNRTPLAMQAQPEPPPVFACPTDGRDWWSGCYGGGGTNCVGDNPLGSCGCKRNAEEFRHSGETRGTVDDCTCGQRIKINWLCSAESKTDVVNSAQPSTSLGQNCWCQLKLQDSELVGPWVDNNAAVSFTGWYACSGGCARSCAYAISTSPALRAALCP